MHDYADTINRVGQTKANSQPSLSTAGECFNALRGAWILGARCKSFAFCVEVPVLLVGPETRLLPVFLLLRIPSSNAQEDDNKT